MPKILLIHSLDKVLISAADLWIGGQQCYLTQLPALQRKNITLLPSYTNVDVLIWINRIFIWFPEWQISIYWCEMVEFAAHKNPPNPEVLARGQVLHVLAIRNTRYKYTNIQICKYANIKRHTNIQIHKYTKPWGARQGTVKAKYCTFWPSVTPDICI